MCNDWCLAAWLTFDVQLHCVRISSCACDAAVTPACARHCTLVTRKTENIFWKSYDWIEFNVLFSGYLGLKRREREADTVDLGVILFNKDICFFNVSGSNSHPKEIYFVNIYYCRGGGIGFCVHFINLIYDMHTSGMSACNKKDWSYSLLCCLTSMPYHIHRYKDLYSFVSIMLSTIPSKEATIYKKKSFVWHSLEANSWPACQADNPPI